MSTWTVPLVFLSVVSRWAQGLFTKVAQIAAKNLGVRFEDVHVLETSTEKIPSSGASPTAAFSKFRHVRGRD